jgi:hypothetical protein
MTKSEITSTDTGSVVSFEETQEERDERLRQASNEAAEKVQLTAGQRRVLARAQDRHRRQPSSI